MDKEFQEHFERRQDGCRGPHSAHLQMTEALTSVVYNNIPLYMKVPLALAPFLVWEEGDHFMHLTLTSVVGQERDM